MDQDSLGKKRNRSELKPLTSDTLTIQCLLESFALTSRILGHDCMILHDCLAFPHCMRFHCLLQHAATNLCSFRGCS